MSKIARDVEMSRQGLIKALSEDGNPRLDTTMKVLAALGLRLTVTPHKKSRKKAA